MLLCCAQSCPTLCNPMDCSSPASSVSGIFQARILKWVAISNCKGYPWPRDGTSISSVSCIGQWILYPVPPETQFSDVFAYILSFLTLSPSPSSHSPRSSQSTDLSSLQYTAGSHYYLFYTWQCVYVNVTLSICPTLPFPPVSICSFSTSGSLFLPGKQVHLTIFPESMYMH